MLTAPQPTPDTDGPGTAVPAEPCPPGACAALSNDYLNHYSEVLMLLEMAPYDPEVGAELMHWHPVDYVSYFGSSELRRAAAALAAYEALPAVRRDAFEKLIREMDSLAVMATFALQPPCEVESAAVVVEMTAPALRRLIAQAAAFLNSGGEAIAPDDSSEEAQAVIDQIIERAASGD